jgi:ParB/RepB/Spo0J family partition protein
MAATPDDDDTITQQVPLDELRAPTHDVRQERSDDDVATVAESMERSGQLHAAYVVPIVPSDAESEESFRSQSVREQADQCAAFRIVDGFTRFLAARELNWATLRCEIHGEEPDDQPIVSLEANTSRVDMSDYETTRALHDHYQRTGLTQAEIAERAGVSRSHLSNLFRALDGHDDTVRAWKDPNSHVTSSHVLLVEQLETQPHKDRAFRDLVHNQRSVGMFEEVVENVRDMEQRELKDAKRQLEETDEEVTEEKVHQLVDGTGPDTTDTPGQAKTRQAESEDETPVEPDPVACLITGAPASLKKAIPVSEEVAGLIERCEDQNVPLLDALSDQNPDQEADSSSQRSEATSSAQQ